MLSTSKILRTLAVPVLAAAAVLAVSAGSASAAPRLPAPSVSATSLTWLSGDPDSGYGTPDVWATDTMWRLETVTRGAQVTGTDCGLTATAGCWAYTANLNDFGWFTTIPGAGTPNQSCAGCAGEKIRRQVSGTLQGSYTVTFYASSPAPDASRVPGNHNDHGAKPNAPFTSTTWGELFFPPGTSFNTPAGGPYKWTYTALTFPVQRWVDSSANGDGDQPGDGNISG